MPSNAEYEQRAEAMMTPTQRRMSEKLEQDAIFEGLLRKFEADQRRLEEEYGAEDPRVPYVKSIKALTPKDISGVGTTFPNASGQSVKNPNRIVETDISVPASKGDFSFSFIAIGGDSTPSVHASVTWQGGKRAEFYPDDVLVKGPNSVSLVRSMRDSGMLILTATEGGIEFGFGQSNELFKQPVHARNVAQAMTILYPSPKPRK